MLHDLMFSQWVQWVQSNEKISSHVRIQMDIIRMIMMLDNMLMDPDNGTQTDPIVGHNAKHLVDPWSSGYCAMCRVMGDVHSYRIYTCMSSENINLISNNICNCEVFYIYILVRKSSSVFKT